MFYIDINKYIFSNQNFLEIRLKSQAPNLQLTTTSQLIIALFIKKAVENNFKVSKSTFLVITTSSWFLLCKASYKVILAKCGDIMSIMNILNISSYLKNIFLKILIYIYIYRGMLNRLWLLLN